MDNIANSKTYGESGTQHYVFVHRVLRDLFFNMPDKLTAILSHEDRDNSLLDLWSRVGSAVGESSLLQPEGLCCSISICDGTTVAVITLPTPQVVCEAHFVALVYRPPTPGQNRLARFLTLECSFGAAILCEWSDANTHLNMGYQCEPDLGSFFQAVCRMCELEQCQRN